MEAVSKQYPHEEFAGIVRRLLPHYLRDWETVGRDEVKTGVWLVGLASAVLAFLAGNDGLRNETALRVGIAPVVVLAATIILGVAHRVLYQLYEADQRAHFRNAMNALLVYEVQGRSPFPLQEEWTESDIVRHLREEFDLDYCFLQEYEVPLDRCREIYKRTYDSWRTREDEGHEEVQALLRAFSGEDENVDASSSPKTFAERLGITRTEARRLNRLEDVCSWLYALAGITFALAMLLVAYALASAMCSASVAK